MINIDPNLLQNRYHDIGHYEKALEILEIAKDTGQCILISDEGEVKIATLWERFTEAINGLLNFCGFSNYIDHTSKSWIDRSVSSLEQFRKEQGQNNSAWNDQRLLSKIQNIAGFYEVQVPKLEYITVSDVNQAVSAGTTGSVLQQTQLETDRVAANALESSTHLQEPLIRLLGIPVNTPQSEIDENADHSMGAIDVKDDQGEEKPTAKERTSTFTVSVIPRQEISSKVLEPSQPAVPNVDRADQKTKFNLFKIVGVITTAVVAAWSGYAIFNSMNTAVNVNPRGEQGDLGGEQGDLVDDLSDTLTSQELNAQRASQPKSLDQRNVVLSSPHQLESDEVTEELGKIGEKLHPYTQLPKAHKIGEEQQKVASVPTKGNAAPAEAMDLDKQMKQIDFSKLTKEQFQGLFKGGNDVAEDKRRFALIPPAQLNTILHTLSQDYLCLMSDEQMQQIDFSKLTKEQFQGLFKGGNDVAEDKRRFALIPPAQVIKSLDKILTDLSSKMPLLDYLSSTKRSDYLSSLITYDQINQFDFATLSEDQLLKVARVMAPQTRKENVNKKYFALLPQDQLNKIIHTLSSLRYEYILSFMSDEQFKHVDLSKMTEENLDYMIGHRNKEEAKRRFALLPAVQVNKVLPMLSLRHLAMMSDKQLRSIDFSIMSEEQLSVFNRGYFNQKQFQMIPGEQINKVLPKLQPKVLYRISEEQAKLLSEESINQLSDQQLHWLEASTKLSKQQARVVSKRLTHLRQEQSEKAATKAAEASKSEAPVIKVSAPIAPSMPISSSQAEAQPSQAKEVPAATTSSRPPATSSKPARKAQDYGAVNDALAKAKRQNEQDRKLREQKEAAAREQEAAETGEETLSEAAKTTPTPASTAPTSSSETNIHPSPQAEGNAVLAAGPTPMKPSASFPPNANPTPAKGATGAAGKRSIEEIVDNIDLKEEVFEALSEIILSPERRKSSFNMVMLQPWILTNGLRERGFHEFTDRHVDFAIRKLVNQGRIYGFVQHHGLRYLLINQADLNDADRDGEDVIIEKKKGLDLPRGYFPDYSSHGHHEKKAKLYTKDNINELSNAYSDLESDTWQKIKGNPASLTEASYMDANGNLLLDKQNSVIDDLAQIIMKRPKGNNNMVHVTVDSIFTENFIEANHLGYNHYQRYIDCAIKKLMDEGHIYAIIPHIYPPHITYKLILNPGDFYTNQRDRVYFKEEFSKVGLYTRDYSKVQDKTWNDLIQ